MQYILPTATRGSLLTLVSQTTSPLGSKPSLCSHPTHGKSLRPPGGPQGPARSATVPSGHPARYYPLLPPFLTPLQPPAASAPGFSTSGPLHGLCPSAQTALSLHILVANSLFSSLCGSPIVCLRPPGPPYVKAHPNLLLALPYPALLPIPPSIYFLTDYVIYSQFVCLLSTFLRANVSFSSGVFAAIPGTHDSVWYTVAAQGTVAG